MANSAPTNNGTLLSSSLPIERKLPLLILGVLAFVLALSLVISYYAIRRSTQIAAGDRLASLSRVIAQLYQQQTAARLTLMQQASSDTAILNALRHPERSDEHQAEQDDHHSEHTREEVGVLDEEPAERTAVAGP